MKFLDRLKNFKGSGGLMNNPYADPAITPELEVPEDAPGVRCANLQHVIKAAWKKKEPLDIWVAEYGSPNCLGQSGIPLVSQGRLGDYAERWDCLPLQKTQKYDFRDEVAETVWQILPRVESNVFLWALFPFVPLFTPYHATDVQPVLPRHDLNTREKDMGRMLLTELIRGLKPERVVSFGYEVEQQVRRIEVSRDAQTPEFKSLPAAHPSDSEFQQSLARLYEVPDRQRSLF